MMGMRGVGLIGGVLMISLALGYFVLYLAKRQDNPIKALGYAIGVFIIVASGALLLDKAVLYILQLKRSCPLH